MNMEDVFDKIRQARIKRMLTNCYALETVKNPQTVLEHGEDFLVICEDNGVFRLLFFARDWKGVDQLLAQVDTGKYFIEFMTKDRTEYVPMKAALTAAMKRMSNPDCNTIFNEGAPILKYRDPDKAEYAGEPDCKEVNALLWGTFHTEISHLLMDDELMVKIRNRQVLIHRNEKNVIDALLQVEVAPKKFYINQVINQADKGVIHALMLYELDKYVKAGGKYIYAWVEDSNTASLKFHEKYGMKHDGMWSMIYCLDR